MTLKRILATSGGFVPGPTQGTARVGDTIKEALRLTGKDRPRVCLVLTASGDDAGYYALAYEALNAAGCDVTQLKLFPQPSADPVERLTTSDFVWVGGGSVANLLALWELHQVGDAMREAWEQGVILGGVSAGSLCWHTGGTTDSYGPALRPVTNGLGLLPYANGVHMDSESQRRPLLSQLMRDGVLDATAYATDDYVGILYEGIEPVRVIRDREFAAPDSPGAYRFSVVDGEVIEENITTALR